MTGRGIIAKAGEHLSVVRGVQDSFQHGTVSGVQRVADHNVDQADVRRPRLILLFQNHTAQMILAHDRYSGTVFRPDLRGYGALAASRVTADDDQRRGLRADLHRANPSGRCPALAETTRFLPGGLTTT